MLRAEDKRYRQAELAELSKKSCVIDVKSLQVCDASELRQGRMRGMDVGRGWLKAPSIPVCSLGDLSEGLASSSLGKEAWI